MNKLINSLLIVAIGGTLTFAAAQSANPQPVPPGATQPAGPGVYDPGHPRVNEVDQRLENQKDRIQQGVKDGTMTKQEARQAWRNDRRVAAQERRDMAANGGHLTKKEQNQLNHELNHNSQKIYKEKHN
ncbi:MAG TPA: hypothetical protein VFB28_01840 [Terriglobales bacterium]|nr:hypothetical protein [Terriglobales bacterium]